MKFQILTLKANDKTFKCLKLEPVMGGEKAYRNGITAYMLDIFMNNTKAKSRLSYYHDGDVEYFLRLLPTWLASWYKACENKHYIWQTMGFTPAKPDNIIEKENKSFDKHTDMVRFLQEFFNV